MLRRTLLLVALASAAAEPVRAQTLAELTATPEATADAFLRSVRTIRWEAAEVKVMELGRSDAAWRIFWSDELEVLDAALRG